MTPEHYVQNQIRLWCGQHNYLCFRCNVGRILTANNTYFDTGLPSGFSDLLILGIMVIFTSVRLNQKVVNNVLTNKNFRKS